MSTVTMALIRSPGWAKPLTPWIVSGRDGDRLLSLGDRARPAVVICVRSSTHCDCVRMLLLGDRTGRHPAAQNLLQLEKSSSEVAVMASSGRSWNCSTLGVYRMPRFWSTKLPSVPSCERLHRPEDPNLLLTLENLVLEVGQILEDRKAATPASTSATTKTNGSPTHQCSSFAHLRLRTDPTVAPTEQRPPSSSPAQCPFCDIVIQRALDDTGTDDRPFRLA
jgi:hypothetical protein